MKHVYISRMWIRDYNARAWVCVDEKRIGDPKVVRIRHDSTKLFRGGVRDWNLHRETDLRSVRHDEATGD